jgi:phenylacetate-CoA ligase
MHLESWIHGVINLSLQNDEEFRRFAGKYFLHLPSRFAVETYQLYRLNKALRYCREHSSFYRELFRTAGAPVEDIGDLRDLARFPFTEPHHLSESPYRFLCTSQADIARPYSFITSGTTGPKKKIFWTQDDLDRITSFMSAGMSTVADPGDTIVILLPDGKPNSQADLLRQGVLKLGATPVVASADLTANELLAVVEESRCRVIFGYTRNMFRLSKELERQHDLRNKGVEILFLAAEYLPHGMRQQLKRIWNCDIRTHYGLTEMGLGVAVECEAQNGYHFNEADLLLEIVHPETGAPAPPGEEGELVFTTLNREAMPLVRYRTHDLSRLIVEPCSCGTGSLLKIDTVKKRIESMAMVGDGDTIYPALFDDVLFEIPGVLDYQVIAAQENGRDRLDFKIEMIPDQTEGISEIRRKLLSAPVIARNIALKKMLEPGIELVPTGGLQSVGRAKKMIVDRRLP